MQNYLEQKIGKVMSTKEVAKFLKVDVSTVRKYYEFLGGIRLGRSYRFFDQEVKNAIQKREQVVRASAQPLEIKTENFQDQERSTNMGGGTKEQNRRKTTADNHSTEDRHGLLN